MISSISSLSNPRIKELVKQTRDSSNQLFVIESVNLIKELSIDAKGLDIVLLTQSFLDNNKWIRNQQDIVVVNDAIISKLAFTKQPPQCIAIKKLSIPNFKITKDNYLILDEIKDPGNLATIIRSAIAFGIDHLFISNNSVSLYNEKVLRSTMGTIFNIKVNYYNDLTKLVNELEANNIECIASCLDKQAIALDKYQPKKDNCALIVGNESHGINKKFLEHCKNKCFIKINQTNSLNVACATAILLYQFSLWKK